MATSGFSKTPNVDLSYEKQIEEFDDGTSTLQPNHIEKQASSIVFVRFNPSAFFFSSYYREIFQ
jgi:hypothetical protein